MVSRLLQRGAILSGMLHAVVLAGLILGVSLRLPKEPEEELQVELAPDPGEPSPAPIYNTVEAPAPSTVQAP